MRPGAHTYPLRDVLAYPPSVLERDEQGVRVSAHYARRWQDGFGARGWKLNHTLDDPEIIASTRETGEKIPTSVFVHDVLDHLLSGFAPSGHRAEAMALAQLGKRTGADIRSDYQQMVREDLLAGRAVGESLEQFIGPELLAHVSDTNTPGAIIAALRESLGQEALVDRLVARFETLGHAGDAHAQQSWQALGLARDTRARIGLALQQVLTEADTLAQAHDLDEAEARIHIHDADTVSLELDHRGGRHVFTADV